MAGWVGLCPGGRFFFVFHAGTIWTWGGEIPDTGYVEWGTLSYFSFSATTFFFFLEYEALANLCIIGTL